MVNKIKRLTLKPFFEVHFFARHVATTACLLCLGLLMSGCRELHPLLREEVREQLETAISLEPPLVTKGEILKLEDVSTELPSQILARAKNSVKPQPGVPFIKMDLPTARKIALESNLDLKVALYNPSIAEASYDAEREKFQTIIGAATSYNNSIDALKQSTGVAMGEPFVSVPLRTGGVAKLSMPITSVDNQSSINALYPPGQTYMTGLNMSISQPLLKNAGLAFNNASIRQAGLAMRQTDARTKITAIRVLADTESAYWNYYQAYENLKIQIQQYELALEQVRVARRLVEEGVRTRVEVIRAEAGVARRFDAVIRAETNRRIVEREFKRVMNSPDLPIDSETIVMTETQPTPASLTFDRDKVEKLAFHNRMELLDNEIQQMINSITVDVRKNQLLPQVNLNFNYSFLGSKPKFTETLGDLFNETLNGYTVGLDLSYPLGNRVAEAGLHQAMLQKTQTLAVRAQLELAIRQDVNNAMDSIEQNWHRVLSNRKAAILSAQAYEIDRIEFQFGSITTLDVLVSLTSVTDARSAEIQSLTDFQQSLVGLAIATGTVLGRGGVIWKPETVSTSK